MKHYRTYRGRTEKISTGCFSRRRFNYPKFHGYSIIISCFSTATYTLKWPSDDDLSGAASALTRLQDTYKLDVDDLAHGQLDGVATGSVLSAHDCFELGRQSYNGGDAIHTVQWMKQALKRFEEEDKKTVDKVYM